MRKNKAGKQQNGFSILALDDDATITAALEAYFEASGFAVDTENDPLAALERMKTKHYDILLLDYLMTPICGDAVVERMRMQESNRDVFIILLTGHKELAPPLNTIRALDIQGYYEKSNRFDQLELLVESCMKSIRQMRVIRSYRDALARVLEVTPSLHSLRPLWDMAREVLDNARRLLPTDDGFVLLDTDDARADAAFAPDVFLGQGSYDMPMAEFLRDEYPALCDACAQSLRAGAPLQNESLVYIPLLSVTGRALGVIALSSAAAAEEDYLMMLSVYGKQAAISISNAVMHQAITEKNEALSLANERLRASYIETITALRLMVDGKDLYTRGHSDRTSYYAVLLAREAGLSEDAVERVRVAGLFHDVGKIAVSDAILAKRTALDSDEFDQMKKHPRRGAEIIASMTMFAQLPDIIAAHHERMDGKGYPDGLAGENIPTEARIIAIADAYDAMTSHRVYANDMNTSQAETELENGRGTQFDARLIDLFLRILRRDRDKIERDLAATYGE